ncbi:MAG: choice-of-anchor D domain-containing protein [Deltaproteobacteria bacterium]|nr:choice-of-anchor D domain-containing protein [Deltaproteobacteria bacterium]
MRYLALSALLLAACQDNTLYNAGDKDPVIRITPSLLSFDEESGDTLVVTVESVGGASLDVSALSLAEGELFALSTGTDLPGLLSPDSSAEIEVTWLLPGIGGDDTLTISSTDASLPEATVAISAASFGVAALSLDPASWDFGTVAVGDTAEQRFTVTNSGEASATLSEWSTTGAGFSVDYGAAAPVEVEPGDAIQLVVSFSPTAAGASVGSLSVRADALPDLSGTLSGEGLDVPATREYAWTGAPQSYTVPPGVSEVLIKAWGAGGGAGEYGGRAAGYGGGGAFAQRVVAVSPGEVLKVQPGQGGIMPGGGAGASYVSRADDTLLIVAAGGGGGGTDGGGVPDFGDANGGPGGATVGGPGGGMGLTTWGSVTGGDGGTLLAGGAGGRATPLLGGLEGYHGGDGASMTGGMPGTRFTWTLASWDAAGTSAANGSGGGGGAGYYGGGGGAGIYTYVGAGGGGGSSWAVGGTVEAGTGATPGNTGDADYDGIAGQGGVPGVWPTTHSTDGAGGRIVIQES